MYMQSLRNNQLRQTILYPDTAIDAYTYNCPSFTIITAIIRVCRHCLPTIIIYVKYLRIHKVYTRAQNQKVTEIDRRSEVWTKSTDVTDVYILYRLSPYSIRIALFDNIANRTIIIIKVFIISFNR